MKEYYKALFGTRSGADRNLEYKIGEINIAEKWNPGEEDPVKCGGFNFSDERSILRWLIRGDTIYKVAIPEDAEVIEVKNPYGIKGCYRTNKIILTDPVPVTDDVALKLYEKSCMPDVAYYKTLAGLAIRGCEKACMRIIEDKISIDNIDEVIKEVTDFIGPNEYNKGNNAVYNKVMFYLLSMKNSQMFLNTLYNKSREKQENREYIAVPIFENPEKLKIDIKSDTEQKTEQ